MTSRSGKTQAVGKAGEHYAAMRLNLLRVQTHLAAAGAPISDMLVHHNGRTASVQVKTSSSSIDKPDSVDMHAEKVGLTDFLVIVFLGTRGVDPVAAQPVAYVLPRAATIDWCLTYSDRNVKRPVTRMNLESRAFLEPYREAWQLVAEHLQQEAA